MKSPAFWFFMSLGSGFLIATLVLIRSGLRVRRLARERGLAESTPALDAGARADQRAVLPAGAELQSGTRGRGVALHVFASNIYKPIPREHGLNPVNLLDEVTIRLGESNDLVASIPSNLLLSKEAS